MKIGTKVEVYLNNMITAKGFIVSNSSMKFGADVKKGNKAVKITKIMHPIAKLGVFQFKKENLKPIVR